MSSFNLLAGFHTVCQTLNISEAARSLGISQPALTRQLQRLSEDLGVELLVRRQRGVELTDAGRALYQATGPAISALQDRLELVKAQHTELKGRIRIGSLAEIGKSYIMPRLVSFGIDFPEVEIELQLIKGKEILSALDARKIDFGVLSEKPANQDFRIIKLFDEKSVLVTRAPNRKDVENIGDVVASRFVAYRADDPLLNRFLGESFGQVSRPEISPQVVINDHRCMIEVLLSIDSYAVMPIHSISGHLQSGSLRQASPHEVISTIWLARPYERKLGLIKEKLLIELSKANHFA